MGTDVGTGGQKPRMILQYNTPSLTDYGGQNALSMQKIICSGWGRQVESGNNKPIVTHRVDSHRWGRDGRLSFRMVKGAE